MSIVIFIGAATTAAIVRYDVDGALKIWAALGSVVGLLTGAFVTYFFTRGAVDAEKKTAELAERQATQAKADASAARTAADDRLAALVKAAGMMDKTAWAKVLEEDRVFARALKSD
jgi:hypothetical protein